ncbi:Ig-like domain-containing protein [Oceanobacillus profundus]|uniref:SbsA Ig-like domain-containing protein n=1 Tax=Oceanobacillus profundus TaxID=372463 RepID=A0A417YGW2_9BACI|nr:hypothetical protein [Oceanobacillus profundus]RHW31989.1 hypothetical protein D1B32_12185 [Oceanobacillus profundus]
MKDLGVLNSDSTILLEILTKDASGNAIDMDQPVIARIERQNGDGVVAVDSVTLNTSEDRLIHSYSYALSSSLEKGKYYITYQVSINNQVYHKVETFQIQEAVTEEIVDNSDSVSYGDKLKHVMPSDFQTPSTLEVDGKKLIIRLEEPLNMNHTYQVIITDELVSEQSQSPIDGTYGIHFTSEYSPIYATPLEVKSILKNVFFYFEIEEVYQALRNAAQKAHQLLRMAADPNETEFELIETDESTYFPAGKFTAYQASIQLLNQLVIKMVYANSQDYLDNDDVSIIQEGVDSFTLGDLTVSKKSSTSDSSTSVEEEPLEVSVIQRLIRSYQEELKFWTDALMGRNARGYANAITATSKGSVTVPGSRDI